MLREAQCLLLWNQIVMPSIHGKLVTYVIHGLTPDLKVFRKPNIHMKTGGTGDLMVVLVRADLVFLEL